MAQFVILPYVYCKESRHHSRQHLGHRQPIYVNSVLRMMAVTSNIWGALCGVITFVSRWLSSLSLCGMASEPGMLSMECELNILQHVQHLDA